MISVRLAWASPNNTLSHSEGHPVKGLKRICSGKYLRGGIGSNISGGHRLELRDIN